MIGAPAPAPAHVWIPGHFELKAGRRVWISGRFAVPPAPGKAWVPGHYERVRGRQVWIAGHWR